MSWPHIWKHGNGHRYSALKAFVDDWFGGFEPEDGIPVPESSDLPDALVEFYRLVGARDDLVRAHHVLLAPEDIEVDGEYVPFWVARDGHYSWGFRPQAKGGREVAVWFDARALHLEEDWIPSSASMSRFLTQMVMVEVAFAAARFGGTLAPSAESFDLTPVYVPLDFEQMPGVLEDVHGSESVLIARSPGARLHVGARDRIAWRNAVAYFEGRGFEWEVEWSD